MVIEQYSVYWADLNPTRGSEMNKIRPCVILSPSANNKYFKTVIAAPITSTNLGLPTRCLVSVGNVNGFVAIDQMRALDKSRFCQEVGQLDINEKEMIKAIIQEYLVD